MQQKSRGPQRIGDVLANVMARRGYGNQQSSKELETTWLQAAGQKLADLSRPGSLRRGTLEIVVKNSLALQDALEQLGVFARVMSAIVINEVCEDYIRRRAIRHLEKGRVVIFAAGTGNPFFTTDSAASLRAVEINAELLIKATKVDGVYSADPVLDKSATRYESLKYDDVIERKLGVMDTTVVVLCRENNMPLRVLDMMKKGALMRAALGQNEGTLVTQ